MPNEKLSIDPKIQEFSLTMVRIEAEKKISPQNEIEQITKFRFQSVQSSRNKFSLPSPSPPPLFLSAFKSHSKIELFLSVVV